MQLLDIEFTFSLVHQVLVQLIVHIGTTQTVLEIVYQHNLQIAQIEPIQLIRLYFQMWVVLFIDTLELIRTYLLDQGIINVINIFLERRYIFGANELVIVSLKKGHVLNEICHLVLVRRLQNIVVFNQILRNNEVVVHHEP